MVILYQDKAFLDQDKELSAESKQGFVEFYGEFARLNVIFFGGWVAIDADNSDESVKVTANFDGVSADILQDYIFHKRDDLADRGIGFVFFVSLANLPNTAFLSLNIIIGDSAYALPPLSGCFKMSEQALADYVQSNHRGLIRDTANRDIATSLYTKIKVENFCSFHDVTVVDGWLLGASDDITVTDAEGLSIVTEICFFSRSEVLEKFPYSGVEAFGFLIIITGFHPSSSLKFGYGGGRVVTKTAQVRKNATTHQIDDLLIRNTPRLGYIMSRTMAFEAWVALIVPKLEELPKESGAAIGWLEQARCVDDLGGMLIGWALSIPPWQISIVSSAGKVQPIALAGRWNRSDVNNLFAERFGSFAVNAGFAAGFAGEVKAGDPVYLIAHAGDKIFRLSQTTWTPAPLDPVSYARWAFDFPIPLSMMSRDFDMNYGFIINELLIRKNEALQKSPATIADFGESLTKPKYSLLVPLYGRFDFMHFQLLEFADDKQLRAEAEIIYIVDDPSIVEQVAEFSPVVHEATGVSFRLVTSCVNRGFAGATNLGARFARGTNLVLLNSDVIPQKAAWLASLSQALEDAPRIGIVGARLLHANMTVQHDGMSFEWEPSWHAHLNKHPGSGLAPGPSSSEPIDCTAVTAACALISLSLYQEIGGLDENFLVGDFEDSDLCLRIRGMGLRVVCVQDVCLVHLERQSFSRLGSNRFREALARYNAFKHEKRWGAEIRNVAKELEYLIP